MSGVHVSLEGGLFRDPGAGTGHGLSTFWAEPRHFLSVDTRFKIGPPLQGGFDMPMIPAQMDPDRAHFPQKRPTKKQTPVRTRERTKKAQILSLYSNGITEIPDLAQMTDARPSYVASVLQASGLLSGYFDLYTHSVHPMNVYSKFFSGRLGFRDERTARESVEILARYYDDFQRVKDRAGQHHALSVALTMFDRARWCGKRREAEVFRVWLTGKLNEDEASTSQVPSEKNRSSH